MENRVTYFPKVCSPYERDEDGFVTGVIRDGYEWVFEETENVKAVEKLDGENVSVTFDSNFEPVGIHRRNGAVDPTVVEGRAYNMAEIPLWEGDKMYTEGVLNAFDKGWIDYISEPGQHFGELVGPRVQGNRYDLSEHYWVPFDYAAECLEIESYGQYGVAFSDIESWFEQTGIVPLFYHKMHDGLSFEKASERHDVEGVVFTHTDPSSIEIIPYAKIRGDMFDG
jgi:hypothetical protein